MSVYLSVSKRLVDRGWFNQGKKWWMLETVLCTDLFYEHDC